MFPDTGKGFPYGMILRLVVGVGLFLWLVGQIDLERSLELLANANPVALGVIFFMVFSSFVLAAYKWQVLVPEFRIRDLLCLQLVGHFFSCVLPGQVAGEVIKVIRLGRVHGGTVRIGISVVLDRGTGLVGLILTGIVGAWYSHISWAGRLTALFIVGLVTALAILFLGRRLRFPSRCLIKSESGIRHRLIYRINGILESVRNYARTPSLVLYSISLGFVTALFNVLITHTLATTLGIHVSFFDWMWILALVTLALAIPLTPAGIGVRDGTLVACLGLVGVNPEAALAISFGILALHLGFALIGGGLDLLLLLRSRRPS